MTKEKILNLIAKRLDGQGNQIDAGAVLPEVLQAIMDVAQQPFASCRKIETFLYELSYNNIDYEEAQKYMDERYLPKAFCSAVRNGEYVGRNLDELYDNSVSLIVKVAPSEERYASIGLVSGIPTINRELMETGQYEDILKYAPFYTMDGVNEKGLFAEMNLLNREGEKGKTFGTTPEIEERERINMLMLTRYIIDNYSSVDEAVEDIRNYVSIYAPETLNYEYHYMLADAEKTIILEFVNNEIYVREVGEDKDYPAINMNFYAHNVTPDAQTKTIQRNTSSAPGAHNINGVSSYGMGIERYNIANARYGNANTAEGMRLLMRDLFYTKAYTLENNKWFTEFVEGDLTVTSPEERFAQIMSEATEAYNNRDRNNPKVWQTIHSAVYDIKNKTILVCVQEGDQYHEVALYSNGNGLIGDLADLATDHKSNVVEAINELFGVLETPNMEISMMQSNAQRKLIYDECVKHLPIAKNIVFYNVSDAMYYKVNGYNLVNGILYLHTVMANGTGLRSVSVQIASNGSISVAQ